MEYVTPEMIAEHRAKNDLIFATYISITDLTKNWVPNQWIGSTIKIVKGTGYGQTRKIISNDQETLYIAQDTYDGFIGQPWTILPGTDFVIQPCGGWTRGFFRRRDCEIGSRQINQDETLFVPMNVYEIWDKFSDGVAVNWNDGVNSGTEKYGDCRTGKKVLNINNQLIQNQYLARSLAKYIYAYVSVKRREIKDYQTIPLIDLEVQDRVKPVVQEFTGLNIWYIIDKVKLSLQDGVQTMNLIQQ